jgi:putative Mg2+ transporter-C (MgtC) family protein
MDVADLSTLDVVVRVVGGALLGAVVGIERESAGQDAGFRTHLLLAMGAALFSVASVGAFDSFITDSDTNVQIDVTRIASYVAAGIGFIGGGVIVKQHGSVRGITTAASVWVAAAIGLSAGLGFWAGAISATLVAVVALYVLKPVSHLIGERNKQRELVVSLSPPAASSSTTDISTVIQACGPTRLRSIDVERPGDGEPTQIVLTFPDPPPDDIVETVAGRLHETIGDRLQSVELRSSH